MDCMQISIIFEAVYCAKKKMAVTPDPEKNSLNNLTALRALSIDNGFLKEEKFSTMNVQ